MGAPNGPTKPRRRYGLSAPRPEDRVRYTLACSSWNDPANNATREKMAKELDAVGEKGCKLIQEINGAGSADKSHQSP